MELIFADLATVEKRLDRISREAKAGASKDLLKIKDVLEKLQTGLNSGHPAREIIKDEDEKLLTKDLNLLTIKPIIYVLNTDGLEVSEFLEEQAEIIKLNVKLEADIAALPEEDRAEFVNELGLSESGLDKLIRAAYKTLNLVTFLTTGQMETRAWTVHKDSFAPQAAAVIHIDFEKGFVRAEIISYDKLIEAGNESRAKELGYMRTEGKNYIIKDGDVCHFLINK